MKKLLEKNHEAAYWLGFIAADGCYTENKRVIIGLAIKDHNHLIKFQNFIGVGNIISTKNNRQVSWSHMNKKIVKDIMEEYDFKPRKTYNPPNKIPYQDHLLLKSYLAGFIDGDGCIINQTNRKSYKIIIKTHKSWANHLEQVSIESGLNGTIYFEKNNKYSILGFYKTEDILNLKKHVIDFNLPILERKWNLIDTDFEIYQPRNIKYEIIELIKNGFTNKEISKKLNVSPGYISRFDNRKNIEKTHCTQGHELVGKNIYIDKRNPTNKICRECRNAKRRK